MGGEKKNTSLVSKLYKDRFGVHLPIIETSFQTAELIKYMNNLFFATKGSLLNEMYRVAEKVDADWDEAIEGFILDGRFVILSNAIGPEKVWICRSSSKEITFISFGEK